MTQTDCANFCFPLLVETRLLVVTSGMRRRIKERLEPRMVSRVELPCFT